MTSPPGQPIEVPRPARLLETALLFTIFAHAAGMLSMALLLLPGMPGGPQADALARAGYLAAHPWLWRLGWLPWQVTAASDLLLCIALLATPWIPRLPAWLALVATVGAIVPDQLGQWLWTWEGVRLAAEAVGTDDGAAYLQFESVSFRMTAGWGPVGYIAGAIGWTWCFAAAGVWSRGLTWLSVATWGLFAAATAVLHLPESFRGSAVVATAVSAGNAGAFVLLMAWLAWAGELVMRRSRPEASYGGLAAWRHPSRGPLARVCDVMANSRLVREVGRWLPSARMASDITDAVYVNYLVEAGSLERLVAHPLKLQRLGPGGRFAMFTFLVFRHGHFGPAIFGPLRRVWPSPIQTNWRLYVYNPATGVRGVQFLTTAITSTPHALVTRLLTDGVPMHVPAGAGLERDGGGGLHLRLDPGRGSAADVEAELTPCPEPGLEVPWGACFGSWREMLEYCVPQDRAMCLEPGTGRILRQEIDLKIPIEGCRPLAGRVESGAAEAIVGKAIPMCFVAERVAFLFRRARPDVSFDRS